MLNKIILSITVSLCFCTVYADDNLSDTNNLAVSSQVSGAQVGVSTKLLRKSAPSEYTVKRGDTVTKLALMYLTKVGYWPQFLGVKSIYATKLYVGDSLRVVSLDGYKVLLVDHKTKSSSDYVKLEPTVRDVSLDALPPISTKALRSLFLHPTLMLKPEFESLPTIVGSAVRGEIYYMPGDTAYVKGYSGQAGDNVTIYSKMRTIKDPDTNEELGYEVRYDGDGVIEQVGPISTLSVGHTNYPIGALDKVSPIADQLVPEITPHLPSQIISGKIIALYDALTSTAENNSVVINRGARDGVELGQVYDITDTQKFIDPTSDTDDPKYLLAPPQTIGEVLIYKVYDKLSFGLITDSSHPILLNASIQSQQ